MGASAYNQCMEIPNDSRMKRTSRRPLVSGKISQLHAFIAATTAGCSGVALLALCVNPLTAGLAAGNIGLYALVYTPMKQHSVWNTWLGAIVGAIPPMMGWAAVTGGLGTGGWVMGAMLFSWQIPHFLSLAYMMRADYKVRLPCECMNVVGVCTVMLHVNAMQLPHSSSCMLLSNASFTSRMPT